MYLFISLSLSPSFISLSNYVSMYLCIYLPIYLSVCLSVCACLPVCLSTCLSASLKTKLFCETSSGFELDNIRNEAILRDFSIFQLDNVKNVAILRDFVIFQSWQHQQRSNSARLPQYFNLTTSKTKQFCETSSFFEVDSIKNERILRDFLQKWKVACRADGLVPMRFAIFPVHLSKLLRLPRKSDARSYEVLHLLRKIISANLKIWCSKMQPLSGNHRPDLLPPLKRMSLVLRLPRKMHLCRSSSNVPRLPSFLEMRHSPHVLFTFEKVHNPLCLPRESTSEPPNLFCTFWLRNALHTTTACTFSTSQLPKVVRTCGVLYILTWKCASRHNGVQFFISHLARWLRTRRFSEPTFRPSGATNHWKNTVFRDFPTFSRTFIFFLLTLSLLWSSLFYSSLLSASSHLCFSSVHIVGSLTSKLPSMSCWFIYEFKIVYDIRVSVEPCAAVVRPASNVSVQYQSFKMNHANNKVVKSIQVIHWVVCFICLYLILHLIE